MPFTFDKKVSLGQIVTFLGILVMGAMGYQALTGRVDAVVANDAKQDTRLEAMSSTVGDIRNIQIEQGVDIRYIRSFVEEERRNARTAAAASP